MAREIGFLVPTEVGYKVMPAMVVETGEIGEIWVAGALKVDDGNLEHQSEE